MTGVEPDRLVNALLASPAGVALLARFEAEHRPELSWFASPVDSSRSAVAAAVGAMAELPFGELAARALGAAADLAGPWTPDAPQLTAAAYENASAT